MIGFMVKVIVSGVAVYGVTKFLQQTQLLEKLMLMGTEFVDQLLTRLNQEAEANTQVKSVMEKIEEMRRKTEWSQN